MHEHWQEQLAFDRQHIWHPYTSMDHPLPVYPVESANGVRIKLADSQELIDGMASWWCVIHGYNHPSLNKALQHQAGKMAHVMFGGLTHEPAIELARRLVAITADPLQHVFISDSGSVAVEVAMKMAIQYWYAQGRSGKQHMLSLRKGYHGDTFGAMSVCDPVNGMHRMFSHALPQQLFAPAPECPPDQPFETQSLTEMAQLLAEHADELAAVILEPIVQGAGGMRFYHPQYLAELRQLCDRHEVLLILDEIATGFGRTGTLFAYEQANITPDILCVGKALTGGVMSLAATLTTRRVAQGISADGEGVLMHGPTFMGNPLACAVACASIDLLLESPWQQRVQNIEAQLNKQLQPLVALENVQEVRCMGAIGVVELCEPIPMAAVQQRFVELGVWIRPFRNLLYIMPPFIIEAEDLSRLTRAISQVVEELQQGFLHA